MAVRLVPRNVLDQSAQQFHAGRFKDAPEPVVLNVDAVLVIGQSREFAWGAWKLRAPPLSYLSGVKCLLASNALRELRTAAASPDAIAKWQRTAGALLRQVIEPTRWWQKLHWFRLFRVGEAAELDLLLRWAIMVPDAGAAPPPSRNQETLDMMDALAMFAKAYPCWMGADGFPLSWAHYLYGLKHLMRDGARNDLRTAIAVRAGGADKKGFQEYLADRESIAMVSRG